MNDYAYLIDTKLVAYYLIQRGASITDIFTKIASLVYGLKKRGEVYVAFDIGTSDYRLAEQSYYKGHRRTATKKLSIADQVKHEKFNEDYIKLMELFKMTSVRVLGVPGVEADDLISIVTEQIKDTHKITLITGDYDYLHLVIENPGVRLYDFPNNQIILYKDIAEKYGVKSRREFSVLKSIVGDKSDNIKFIRGLAAVKGTAVFEKIYAEHEDPTDEEIIPHLEAIVEENTLMRLYEHHVEDKRTTIKEAFLSNMKVADPFVDTTKMTLVQIEEFNRCLKREIEPEGYSLPEFMGKSIELFGYPIILDEISKKVYNLI